METSHRIMFVEDEWALARDLRRKLVGLGFDVVGETRLGEHAIALAETARPDLVLMDIQLAGEMDGITAAEHIRVRFDIPVVFVTSHRNDHVLRAASAAMPAGYIVKPCSERELEVVVALALYRRAIDDERLRELGHPRRTRAISTPTGRCA